MQKMINVRYELWMVVRNNSSKKGMSMGDYIWSLIPDEDKKEIIPKKYDYKLWPYKTFTLKIENVEWLRDIKEKMLIDTLIKEDMKHRNKDINTLEKLDINQPRQKKIKVEYKTKIDIECCEWLYGVKDCGIYINHYIDWLLDKAREVV